MIFHESIFPFHSHSPTENLIDPFPYLVLPVSSLDIPTSIDPPIVSQPSTQSSTSPTSQSLQPIKRSSRLVKPPSYLRDFHCNLLQVQYPACSSHLSYSTYPLSNHISYHSLSPAYRHFILTVSSHFEPQFYHQAVKFPEWRTTMKDELDALEQNHTWSIVPLPPGKHSIGCKWIFKIKYNSNGSIECHRAILVAKGYTQQEGVEILETFSPIAKLVIVKVLLALVASQKWYLVQMDVNNAFLNGDFFEDVYMDLPLGYHSQGESTAQNQKSV